MYSENIVSISWSIIISICEEIRKEANLIPFEKVDIYNCNNGQRFSTYVILSNKKGEICLNGAAARLVQSGDKVIICSYASFDEEELVNFHPQLVFVNDNNEIIETKSYIDASINEQPSKKEAI